MLTFPHWPKPLNILPHDPDLSRIRTILSRIGNPHRELPPIIHVAGTNGKGSTIAYLKAILEAAGYKVHRYTQPHLIDFNERIELAGKKISDDFLFTIIEETRTKTEDLETTFFEGSTAYAFLAFSRVEADIILVETGMGGREDATNIIEEKELTIITPISLDHTRYLGDSLADIALHKAGIMRKNTPCVISWQYSEAMRSLWQYAANIDVSCYSFGSNWEFKRLADGFQFIDAEESIHLPKPSLLGLHQIINAATAVAACKCLKNFIITEKDIITGLTNTYWPARMEFIKKIGEHELWIDGAHNESGAQMIAATIEADWKDKPTYLIYGVSVNRDIEPFLFHFIGKVREVIGVRVANEPASQPVEHITRAANNLGIKYHAAEYLDDGIEYILQHITTPSRILICGSLFLYGDVKAGIRF